MRILQSNPIQSEPDLIVYSRDLLTNPSTTELGDVPFQGFYYNFTSYSGNMEELVQAFFKVQDFGQPASNFVPNLPAAHREAQQALDLRMPEVPMPMLSLPPQSLDPVIKTEWCGQPNYDASLLLGGQVSPMGVLNREARVLR